MLTFSLHNRCWLSSLHIDYWNIGSICFLCMPGAQLVLCKWENPHTPLLIHSFCLMPLFSGTLIHRKERWLESGSLCTTQTGISLCWNGWVLDGGGSWLVGGNRGDHHHVGKLANYSEAAPRAQLVKYNQINVQPFIYPLYQITSYLILKFKFGPMPMLLEHVCR